jgi:hypothetical protein
LWTPSELRRFTFARSIHVFSQMRKGAKRFGLHGCHAGQKF